MTTPRLAALLALVAACFAPPSQRDPAFYGTLRVALGPRLDGTGDWTPEQRTAIEEGLVLLEDMGPGIAVTTEADPVLDVAVRPADLDGDCGSFGLGSHLVEVDLACASRVGGMLAVQRAANHEVAHYFLSTRYGFAGHLCAFRGERIDCHPTALAVDFQGRPTDALMRAGLGRVDTVGATTAEAYVPPLAEPSPADPDLALARALAGR